VILIIGCNGNDNNNSNSVNGTQDIDPKFEKLTITKDGSFSKESCIERGVSDKVIMLQSKYCGHCQHTIPIFEEACREEGVEPIILDVSIPEQREQMESYGVQIAYTPTFIFGCDYYIGARDKEGYLMSLEVFLRKRLK